MHSRIEPSGCAQSGVIMRGIGVGILILLVGLLLLSTPASSYPWESDTTIVNGLSDIGGHSTLSVFEKDGVWTLVAGEGYNNGVFYGYTWNGTQWVSNSSVISGLDSLSGKWELSPDIFQKDGVWTLVFGDDNCQCFSGYTWNGAQWVSNSSVISGLGGGRFLKPTIYQKDGVWTLVAGDRGSPSFYGYTWNGTQWVSNSSVISGLPDYGGAQYISPTIYQKDGVWTLIHGMNSAPIIRGFTWNGSQWVSDDVVVSGLSSGNFPNPEAFQKDGVLKLIFGENSGVFTGFSLPISEVTPPAPTNLAQTNDSASYVNWTWEAGTGNVTDSFNVSVNGSWTNGSANLFYNHTGITYSSWSNISVFSYNSSGTGTLNTTEVSGSVQLPPAPPSEVTISCPAAGWCYLASNYSSKTLLELDNLFSTDTIQGHYNATSQKYESHRTGYNFNQNVAVAQKEGYYYYFSSAQDVTMTPGSTPSITLRTGWNLVSNYGSSARTLSALKTSVGAEATQAKYYDKTLKTWVSTDSQSVPAMESFFVYVTANTDWSG